MQTLEPRDARRSIQAMIQRQGNKLKAATPAGIITALVAAACMPVVWPLLGGVSETAKAGVALLGLPGGAYISDAIKNAIERLGNRPGSRPSKVDVQEALERELLSCLQGADERAAGLRGDTAALLEHIRALHAALDVAPADLQQALSQAFNELGDSFREFRWMLEETRRAMALMSTEQRRQGRQVRSQLEEIGDGVRWIASRLPDSPARRPDPAPMPTISHVFVSSGGMDRVETSAWHGGAEVTIGDHVYLLWDGLLDERTSHDHSFVRRQAQGAVLVPTLEPGGAFIWLRQVHARRTDGPGARAALAGLAALARERDLLVELRSVRGVPRVVQFADEGDTATLVVRWPSSRSRGAPCESLDAYLEPNGAPIDPWRLFRLCGGLSGLCETLRRLHSNGNVHRDLTPAAVVVLDSGSLVLRDLGLAARSYEPGEGPARYQAPEQRRRGGGIPGPPTDVYQLAAVAYHLMAGCPPNARAPLPVRAQAQNVPSSLSDVLDAALSPDPVARPDVRQLGAALRAARYELA